MLLQETKMNSNFYLHFNCIMLQLFVMKETPFIVLMKQSLFYFSYSTQNNIPFQIAKLEVTCFFLLKKVAFCNPTIFETQNIF